MYNIIIFMVTLTFIPELVGRGLLSKGTTRSTAIN